MIIKEVFYKGKTLIPELKLKPEIHEIIGIQTDVLRKQSLLAELKMQDYIYISNANTGEYERHTVKELLKFLATITGSLHKIDFLIEKFGLTDIQHTRIKHIPYSKQIFIKQLRVYFAQQPTIVLEEPYFYLDESDRKIFSRILDELSSTKRLVILASNLEDALISCHKIYRLDEQGLKQLDIADSEDQEEAIEEPQPFKLEKISTRKNEKTILFDPPEIDYVESVEGTILVHVGGENYSCALTLTELEKRLKSYGFFRCHRSYIVNLQKVREIITWTKNSYSLRLNIGKDSVVPLSRAKLQDLRDLLNI
ncbi:MAG: LytTR family transcriptional regulator DNA-binding domain-containing protein [Kurthia sp.]|nr:LytTR family transcriptional regulator DNA-binding domain-containing protein [Candidatus Kurthia equi]